MTKIQFRALNAANAATAVALLDGKTYMNLRARFYSFPCKGNEFVVVETDYEGATEADLWSMVTSEILCAVPSVKE